MQQHTPANVSCLRKADNARLCAHQGLIIDGKEGKRRLDRKTSEYDAARTKHLNHKYNPKINKWRKGDDADKIHSDMISAQVRPATLVSNAFEHLVPSESSQIWSVKPPVKPPPPPFPPLHNSCQDI